MAERDGRDFPINYEKTLEQARRETAVQRAMESVEFIEARWVRITSAEGYSFDDLKKDILLQDIVDLLRCCIVFLNRICDLEALARHRKPAELRREVKKIAMPFEGESELLNDST